MAQGVGVTAVPTPVADNGSDWFVSESIAGLFNLITAVGTEQLAGPGWLHSIDSKAMRKVSEGQTIVSVAEIGGLSDGALLLSFGRMLIKLH